MESLFGREKNLGIMTILFNDAMELSKYKQYRAHYLEALTKMFKLIDILTPQSSEKIRDNYFDHLLKDNELSNSIGEDVLPAHI